MGMDPDPTIYSVPPRLFPNSQALCLPFPLSHSPLFPLLIFGWLTWIIVSRVLLIACRYQCRPIKTPVLLITCIGQVPMIHTFQYVIWLNHSTGSFDQPRPRRGGVPDRRINTMPECTCRNVLNNCRRHITEQVDWIWRHRWRHCRCPRQRTYV